MRYPWSAVEELYTCYGEEWRITRASLDTWVAWRTIGTQTHVCVGNPVALLAKLDCLPVRAGTVVRVVPAGYLSGSCACRVP
ncbi:MAG TPA: hypothetical protein VK586_07215 [Streptosporangiaceae bacterium]|nr:hypothetical protein [Streptosporangiaceae bacterium]